MTRHTEAQGWDDNAPPVGRPVEATPIPHSLASEQAVLGAMLIDADAVRDVRGLLRPDDFYREGHRHLFAAIAAIHDAGAIPDAAGVYNRLEVDGTYEQSGGSEYIAWLVDSCVTASNATYHADTVKKTAGQRRLAHILTGYAGQAVQPGASAATLAAAAVQDLAAMAATSGVKTFVPVKHLIYDAMEAIEARYRGDATDTVTLGFPEIDNDPIFGVEVGDLVTLVLVSGHGKTALQLSMARWAGEAGVTAGFVSAEMASRQLVNRLLSMYSGIPFGRLRKGILYDGDFPKLARAVGLVAQLPLHVDDTSLPRLSDVGVRMRALKAAHPELRLMFVDYAQLLTADGDSRALQIENISNGMKGLAKELEIVVVQSAQPDGKTIDRRGGDGKMPELADFAWGQGIRNASDLVISGFRPGKYDPNQEDNIMQCRSPKSRGSGVEDFWLRWNGPSMLCWSPQMPAPWAHEVAGI